MYKNAICTLLFVLSNTCLAEPKTYQTESKPSSSGSASEPALIAPLISVNPETGKTRVFITPDGSFSDRLATQSAPVYHARALYESTSSGISDSLIKLYRQMADACPQGWIKLQEWAILQSNTPELHYQFQCLNTSSQD